MKKSTWVIDLFEEFEAGEWQWVIFNRLQPNIVFESNSYYTRKSDALRGARRVAKALRINAEVG